MVPGRSLSLLWNVREHTTDLARWIRALVRERHPGFDEGYRDVDWGEVMISSGHFDNVRHFREHHVVAFSPEDFVARWRSHRRLALALGAELDEVIEAIRSRVDQVPEVRVPYACVGYHARRRP